MGFSVSGSTAIMFLGLVIAAGMVVPTVENTTQRVEEAIDQQDDRMLNQQNTDFNITDATYNKTSDTLTLKVENTGSKTLDANETDVLLDGVIQSGYSTAVNGDSGRTLWTPGSTLKFTIDIAPAPNRIKVVAETGVSKTTTDITIVS